MNVLLIQAQIVHYRIPVFNALGRLPGVNLTVVHSGAPIGGAANSFREERVPVRKCGRFALQTGLRSHVAANDVVIGMLDPQWLSVIGLAIQSEPRSKLLLWGHGLGKRSVGQWLRKWLCRRAAGVILYGDDACGQLLKAGVPPSRVFVAPNTLEVANHGRNQAAKRTLFLYVGSLHVRKGVHQLITAFAAAKPSLPPETRLLIIGSGPEEARLRRLTESLVVQGEVQFRSAVHDEETLRNEFDKALAYVSPGHVGLGVLHSFAYGVGVVTRRGAAHAPEFANIADGITGMLFNEEPNELAEILVQLARSRVLADRLGQAAYEHFVEHRQVCHMTAGFKHAIAMVAALGAASRSGPSQSSVIYAS